MSAEFEIVSTPTMDWLGRRLKECRERFWVASPFVGNVLADVTRSLAGEVEKRLVTRPDIRYFASGMSSLNAIREMASGGVQVQSLGRLHAKVYIVDGAGALVTSANSTYSGLHVNAELGIAVSAPSTVSALAKLYASGFGAPDPPEPVSEDDLEALDRLAKTVRPMLPRIPAMPEDGAAAEEPPPVEVDKEVLLDSFKGWRRLALEGVLSLGREQFSLDDLEPLCEPLASEQGLMYKRPTLRRVMQELRDRGLVEFVDNKGNYRRTFVPSA